MGSKEILTVEETARMLRCSNQYVRVLCGSGKLLARKVGKRWLISREGLRRYLGMEKA